MEKQNLCWCGSGKDYNICHKEFDENLKLLKKKGNIVPSNKLIKTKEQIEGVRYASKINTMVLDEVSKFVKAGVSTEELNKIVYDTTIKLGGRPAPLGYEGFPKSVCISVNNVVCHGIPSDKIVLKEGDIVNIDCTTEVNGFYGDSSRMFEIGNVSDEAHKLVNVAKECLDLAVSKLKPYCHVGDVGHWVSKHARANGCSVVRELGGHGVGLAMHEDPFVSHVAKFGTGMLLVPGMIFTIEPMINAGKASVGIDYKDGWTVFTADGSLSAQWEYTILMTENGPEILAR